MRQVMDATGFGRAWIYELMKRGEFPKAHKIGTRAVGWNSEAVDAWVAAQLGEEL
ncbi:helix-turn-helix transcriptional regulator [Pseudomonas aeruginosa]|uniref:helix-turn-helix transcriptional regulator n=1 Tax=Pseudomonas aeruginosa TaxID=287 RepID=UPI003F589658